MNWNEIQEFFHSYHHYWMKPLITYAQIESRISMTRCYITTKKCFSSYNPIWICITFSFGDLSWHYFSFTHVYSKTLPACLLCHLNLRIYYFSFTLFYFTLLALLGARSNRNVRLYTYIVHNSMYDVDFYNYFFKTWTGNKRWIHERDEMRDFERKIKQTRWTFSTQLFL